MKELQGCDYYNSLADIEVDEGAAGVDFLGALAATAFLCPPVSVRTITTGVTMVTVVTMVTGVILILGNVGRV